VKYEHPGNVRELENLTHRAVVLARDRTLTTADLPIRVARMKADGRAGEASPFVERVAE